MSKSEEHRAHAEQCRQLAAVCLEKETVTSLRRMAALYDALATRADRMESNSIAIPGKSCANVGNGSEAAIVVRQMRSPQPTPTSVGLVEMRDKTMRAVRRAKHTREVEESQQALRVSIAETQRLVIESDKMLRRHRQELDDDDVISSGLSLPNGKQDSV